MEPVERWWDGIERLPPWAVGVLIATLYAVGSYLWGPRPESVRMAVIYLVVGTVIWGVVVAGSRERDCDAMGFGSDSARADVERVLRTGTLPDDTSLDEWTQRLLDRRRSQRERGGAVLRTLMVTLYVAVLVGLLIAGVRGDDPVTAAFGAIGLALVPLMVSHHRRVLRRYDRIEAELAARSGRT